MKKWFDNTKIPQTLEINRKMKKAKVLVISKKRADLGHEIKNLQDRLTEVNKDLKEARKQQIEAIANIKQWLEEQK